MVPIVLRAIFSLAAKPIMALAGRNVTWGSMAAMSALPVGLAAVEYGSDGAASQAAIDAAVAAAKLGIEKGVINKNNIEPQIDNISTLMGIANAFDKTVQNQLVNGMMMSRGDKTSADAIHAGKIAAVGWLMAPHNAAILIGKTGIRNQLVNQMFTNKDEGDKYLAEKFIDDVVAGAAVNALGDNKISRDDVKIALQKELSNPDSTMAGLIKNSRIGNGLRQIWLDIAPSVHNTTTTRTAQNEGPEEQKNTNFFMGILMMLAKFFMGMFNPKGNVSAQTDNPERLAALRQQNGGAMPTIMSHDGVPNAVPAHTPTVPQNNRQLQFG